MNSQPNPESFFPAPSDPRKVRLALGDGDVGVHALPLTPDHGLRQETGRVAHVVRDLAREQL